MNVVFVYITTSGIDEARRIGAMVVEKRLAACVNILPPIESIYRWKGKIENAAETVLIAKTRDELFEPLREAVMAVHSYSNPCIVALDVARGSASYLEWLVEETASA